jgi:hypothetical protein
MVGEEMKFVGKRVEFPLDLVKLFVNFSMFLPKTFLACLLM